MSNGFKFPDRFLWGTATCAHQVEGNNSNSDWWEWEQSKGDREYPLEPSGIACDSYNRYEEDFDLCVKLNNNAVRISVEWARLEPREGEFSEAEFAHYKKVLKSAKDRNLKTFVTLHHFTNPIWFAKKGRWESYKSAHFFARYAKKCAQEFGDLVDVYLTINEPQVYTLMSYMSGIWPPCKKSFLMSLLVQINLMRAHRKAYDAIKSVNPKYQVGIVKNIVWYETLSSKYHIFDQFGVAFMNFIGSGFFLIPIHKKLDLIGLNYYFTSRIGNLRVKNPDNITSDLGWWIYPKGLEKILIDLKKYNLPIYITENGLADAKDEKREEFIKSMLTSCANAIKAGVPLKGYFHWSLLDNYEWHHGFWPRFGLVDVDRESASSAGKLKRTPRKSFYYYADICGRNQLSFP